MDIVSKSVSSGAGEVAVSGTAPLLVLGLFFILLVGPFLMPLVLMAMRSFLALTRFALRRIWQFIVDKIIEAIIFALVAVLGGSYLM